MSNDNKTAPANGTAKKTTINTTPVNPILSPAKDSAKDEAKDEVKPPVKDEVKPDAKPGKVKEDAEELPPIDDRIFLVQKLYDLIEKHDAIKESIKKIDSFKLSTDSNRDELKLTDSKSNVFQTSNTAVIKEVIEVIKTTLKSKLKEVEQQIKF